MAPRVAEIRYQGQSRASLTIGLNFGQDLLNAEGYRLPRPGGGTVKAVRSLLDDPRVFDAVIVLLATWFLLSAYVVAWAYVISPQGVQSAAAAGLVAVSASWFALTGFLFFAFGGGLGRGRPWNHAL